MNKMQILDVVQGTDGWFAEKMVRITSTDAPVIMGVRKFTTRKQLLDAKKGWIDGADIGWFKEKIFATGHRTEDSARELLEIITMEDFPATVGVRTVEGIEMLSSFDGYNPELPHWEHKMWNETLSNNVINHVLEPLYFWQLEQQMLVAGASKCMFWVSDGTLNKKVSMTYESVPERRKALIAGCKQFLIDLGNHEISAKTEVVVAQQVERLPVVSCEVNSGVVESNLGECIPMLEQIAKRHMSLILETDQDFADKKAFNKKVKELRAEFKTVSGSIKKKFKSLDDFESDGKVFDSILQKLQAHGEKQVKESELARKQSIINKAKLEIFNYAKRLSGEINDIKIQPTVDWLEVIKGKRNFEKIQAAVDSKVAELKIEVNEKALIIKTNFKFFEDFCAEHLVLFPDLNSLCESKTPDDFQAIVNLRVTEYKEAQSKKEAETRERIRKEEEAKAAAALTKAEKAKKSQAPVKVAQKEKPTVLNESVNNFASLVGAIAVKGELDADIKSALETVENDVGLAETDGINEAEKKIERLKLDAARYRFLRDQWTGDDIITWAALGEAEGGDFDIIVDAQRSKS